MQQRYGNGACNNAELSTNYIFADMLSNLAKENPSTLPESYKEYLGLHDIDALIDIYYEYKDFYETKSKEIKSLVESHTKKLFESVCAPAQKIIIIDFFQHRNEVTFDETKVKNLEDLDPTQAFKFLPAFFVGIESD